MSRQKESTARTLMVALIVCLVCSVFVASAAIALKPIQTQNRLLDRQRTLLAIAGLGTPEMSDTAVRRLYTERVSARVVDLQTGLFSDAHNPNTFDARRASRDPELSDELSSSQDLASIGRREQFSVVYLVKQDGQLQTLILPVRGAGAWGTIYGFIALQGDLNTVVGLGFYQHSETPGLGGEIDNPNWRALWHGKSLFDASGALAVQIIHGTVNPQSANARHQVDGLAGATLTSRSVHNLLHFWLGENGFGPLLTHLQRLNQPAGGA
jgi:Na+-transporting NADH:ubiquinone oxidoreductase subunit C